ncbi:MAG: NifB/NifX family molybdenum-iron cluster-binding protein [Acidobacteriota bacterium]|nr:NifB/NifX family molybdenum-iron cluster-binding protein [Acidobacteriota bacterium]
MKIAVASVDGVTISQHFGQSTGFIVFDVEGETIRSSEWRAVQQTPHAAGVCQHGGEQPQPGGGLALIRDCSVMVCGGIGGGAANALQQMGLKPMVLPVAGDAHTALARMLRGELSASSTPTCQCEH